MASEKKEYEDLEDILNEMEREGEWGRCDNRNASSLCEAYPESPE